MVHKKCNIHPTAIVEPGAELGEGVCIEPYAVVKGSVILGDDVIIKAHAYIDGNTTIGDRTTIYPFASIGTKTQDMKYRGERTYVKIGTDCDIRECVTINSSCQEDTAVEVGSHCLIMAYCHIAHNCTVGDRVIMSNNATLAGHVIVGRCAIIGGMTPIHQFVRVGAYAMVGGMSRIPYDVPPFTIGGGIPFRFGGVNRIGLQRHGFSLEVRREIHRAFKLLYRSGLPYREALAEMKRSLPALPEILELIRFCEDSKRGLLGIQVAEESGEVWSEEAEPAAAAVE